MLSVEGLRSRYGRIEALHGIDLEVRSGEIVCVVGANGAGKTTLLRCLSGVQPASAGTIVFRGARSLNPPPAVPCRVGLGLAPSPEGAALFTPLPWQATLRLWPSSMPNAARGGNGRAFLHVPDPEGDTRRRWRRALRRPSAMLAIAPRVAGRPALLLGASQLCGLAPPSGAGSRRRLKSLKALEVTGTASSSRTPSRRSRSPTAAYVMETGPHRDCGRGRRP